MSTLMFHPLVAIFPPSNTEIFVIAILVLILFGAKKLPLFARSLGRSMVEFKKAKEEFEQELHRASNEEPAPAPRIQSSPQASPQVAAQPRSSAEAPVSHQG